MTAYEILINPFKNSRQKIDIISKILLRHVNNLYTIFLITNIESEKNIPELMILRIELINQRFINTPRHSRPATHKEVFLIDINYKSNILVSNKVPCPCVMLFKGNTLIIGIPPLHIAGIDWKEEIPTLEKWMLNDNSTNCKLCNSNIIFPRRAPRDDIFNEL